jgi:hypothetical protein
VIGKREHAAAEAVQQGSHENFRENNKFKLSPEDSQTVIMLAQGKKAGMLIFHY